MAVTPYEITLGDKPFWVVEDMASRAEYLRHAPKANPWEVGYVALAAFRKKPYVDYVAVGQINDVTGDETWIKAFEQYEWFDWMAGTVYDQPERAKQLKSTERKLGKFMLEFGWAPNYYLETEPSQIEFDAFIDHVTSKDVVNGNLIIPEERD